jgi:HK97 family phage prohead protease
MKTISGYASVYNKPSCDLGGFTEYITPGAFDKVLRSGNDVMCLHNHDHHVLLGRTSSGTLKVRSDSTGLRYECDLPNTSAGNDVYELCSRGDLCRSSFGFICGEDDWDVDEVGKMTRRVLTVADLIDVSPVTNPAYPDSSVGVVRSATEGMTDEQVRAHVLAMAEKCKRDGERSKHFEATVRMRVYAQLLQSGSSPEEAMRVSGYKTLAEEKAEEMKTQRSGERRSLETDNLSNDEYAAWVLAQAERLRAEADGTLKAADPTISETRRTYRINGKVVTRAQFVAYASERGQGDVEVRLAQTSGRVEKSVTK